MLSKTFEAIELQAKKSTGCGLKPKTFPYPVINVNIEWNFSSVLASDKVCGFPFARYLVRTSQESPGVKSNLALSALDLWREIEKLRTTLARNELSEISEVVRGFYYFIIYLLLPLYMLKTKSCG